MLLVYCDLSASLYTKKAISFNTIYVVLKLMAVSKNISYRKFINLSDAISHTETEKQSYIILKLKKSMC